MYRTSVIFHFSQIFSHPSQLFSLPIYITITCYIYTKFSICIITLHYFNGNNRSLTIYVSQETLCVRKSVGNSAYCTF